MLLRAWAISLKNLIWSWLGAKLLGVYGPIMLWSLWTTEGYWRERPPCQSVAFSYCKALMCTFHFQRGLLAPAPQICGASGSHHSSVVLRVAQQEPTKRTLVMKPFIHAGPKYPGSFRLCSGCSNSKQWRRMGRARNNFSTVHCTHPYNPKKLAPFFSHEV